MLVFKNTKWPTCVPKDTGHMFMELGLIVNWLLTAVLFKMDHCCTRSERLTVNFLEFMDMT